jgi:hypothetical protein
MIRHQCSANSPREHRLHFVDTLSEHVNVIFKETGFERGSFPMVAVADWPDHYRRIAPLLHTITRRWRAAGSTRMLATSRSSR